MHNKTITENVVSPTKDQDMPRCTHERSLTIQGQTFRVQNADTGGVTFVLHIIGECPDCGARLRWRGASTGQSFDHPSMTADGLELRAPVDIVLPTEKPTTETHRHQS